MHPEIPEKSAYTLCLPLQFTLFEPNCLQEADSFSFLRHF